MGDTVQSTAWYNGQVSEGKAQLESTELVFRGDFRLKIPLREVSAIAAADGQLQVTFPDGTARFELGPAAEKWAHKIRNPRTLMDKLGVKASSSVAVIAVEDTEFWRQLRERTSHIAPDAAAGELDILFLGAETREELAALAPLPNQIKRNGAIWVISPKGRQDFTDRDVMAAGLAVGLVDTKVAAFSQTHTAAKFVIPVARRSGRRADLTPDPFPERGGGVRSKN